MEDTHIYTISKFKDYYDIGMSHGQDDDIVFCRTQEEHIKVSNTATRQSDKELALCDLVGQRVYNCYSIDTFIIGFCGKLYMAIKMWDNTINRKQQYERWCYSIEDVIDFIMNHPVETVRSEFNKKDPRRRWHRSAYRSTFNFTYASSNEELYGHYFNTVAQLKDSYMGSFRNYNTPCFVFKKDNDIKYKKIDKVVVNPCLKDYNFQKVYDSYSAYQEISMFIGGILGKGEKETLGRKDFPDEPLIRDSKGFDNWSFKKRPTKQS